MMRAIPITAALLFVIGGMPGTGSADENARNGVSAARLMPLESRGMVYRLNVKKREAEVEASLTPHSSRDRCWWLRVGSHRHSLLRETEDGGIEVLRRRLPDEGMTLTYDPAVPLLPTVCEPGKEVETTGELRIETEDGDIHQGEIVHRVSVIGWIEIETARGTTEALRVRTVDEVDLGLANLRIEAETHYVPGMGRAYQRMVTTRRTLALFSERSEEDFRVKQWRTGMSD